MCGETSKGVPGIGRRSEHEKLMGSSKRLSLANETGDPKNGLERSRFRVSQTPFGSLVKIYWDQNVDGEVERGRFF